MYRDSQLQCREDCDFFHISKTMRIQYWAKTELNDLGKSIRFV